MFAQVDHVANPFALDDVSAANPFMALSFKSQMLRGRQSAAITVLTILTSFKIGRMRFSGKTGSVENDDS